MTRALIACRQMQDCFDAYRPRFDELSIEYVLPTVVQHMTEADLLPDDRRVRRDDRRR